MKTQNKFGFSEIVDSIVDLINAVINFLETFEGGFNMVKFFGWGFEEYPNLREMVEDFDTFLLELGDLTAQEALDAVAAIDARVPDHPVADRVVQALKVASIAYKFFTDTLARGKSIIDLTKKLFEKA